MSGSVEDWDGLCGVIDPCSSFDCRIRCKYAFAHGDKHSWQDKPMSGIFCAGIVFAFGAEYHDQKKRDKKDG